MIILPKNEPKIADRTPKSFLIWGESMSGKTYMAREFESPIIINTDGNADKVDTPSVAIKNFKEFAEVIHALNTQKHTFKTLIIDLIDDIEVMLTMYICEQDKVEALADIPFGKGYAKQSAVWKKLMIELTQMDMTVIFISHSIEKSENNGQTMYQAPSLSQKGLNACMGRCDFSVQTKKIGSNYMRICSAKREAYKEEDIKDKRILGILKTVRGVFEVKPTINTVAPKTGNVTTLNNKITPKATPKAGKTIDNANENIEAVESVGNVENNKNENVNENGGN